MKAFLLHRQRDFESAVPPNAAALEQDLELDTLFDAMAGSDKFLRDVARSVVLSSLRGCEAIRYRQNVLRDCLEHAAVVKELYAVTVETLERHRKVWRWSGTGNPGWVLSSAVDLLQISIEELRRMRRIADTRAHEFRSEGFRTFFAMLQSELDDAYFATLEDHLRRLRFPQGVLVSTELGKGVRGANYVLRMPPPSKWSWRRLLHLPDHSPMTIIIPPRDDAGAQALNNLRERGINVVANAVAQSADHVASFFTMLRFELAFYLACMNLRERLVAGGEPVCMPEPADAGTTVFSARELYEPCLALKLGRRVVGNDVRADRKRLVLITGANQGGKSTFLRSVGVAQLMLQGGMFVAATEYRSEVCTSLFTHYRREEDVTMESGKLDEELKRMSEIVDAVRAGSVVLFNESFGATNEREGAEIARGIIRALLEANVKVVFVTHSYELASGLASDRRDDALFLLAERRPDGARTFRLIEGDPRPTSYGEDLYKQVFGVEADAAMPPPSNSAGGSKGSVSSTRAMESRPDA